MDHKKIVENSLIGRNTRSSVLPPEKSVYRSRNKLELDMEEQIGFKSGKEYVKAVYYHLGYLIYMQGVS